MKLGRPIKTAGFSIDINQFLKVRTKEVAYFLGFLWADGSIRKHGNYNSVEIEIKEPDAECLRQYFFKLGKWNVQIRKRLISKYRSVKFNHNNRPLVDYLISLGYKNKSVESPKKVLSIIPKNLQNYFWRGYLDGDGCVYLTKSNGIRINFWGTYNQDWSSLQSLCKSLKAPFTVYKYARNKNNQVHKSSTLYINDRAARKRFLNYIYRGEKIGLERKKEKYDAYFTT